MPTFLGTASGDRITPSALSAGVTANGAVRPSDLADSLDGAGGDDTLDGGGGADTLSGGEGADSLLGGAGRDLVAGNRGADVVSLGADDDTFLWNPGDGDDTVDGGAGSDVLQLNGASIAERFTLFAGDGHAQLTRDVGVAHLDLTGMETLTVRALGGADVFTIGNLAGTGVTQVNVDLSGPAGTPDDAADVVIVGGGDNADQLSASLTNGGVTVLGLAERVAVLGADGLDTVLVDGRAGVDAFTFNGSA
ncbi:MAG TPA: hypothetical protein VF495_25300, partial [Phenylobacterium sp.]